MIRVVIDNNVFVSALIKRNGAPGRILDAQRRGRFDLVTSAPLLHELETVLVRPHILKLIHATESTASEFVARLRADGIVVIPDITITAVERDPADNRVLEAAVTGHVDFIVTGDQDLLVLESFQGIPVVTPARFLAILTTAP